MIGYNDNLVKDILEKICENYENVNKELIKKIYKMGFKDGQTSLAIKIQDDMYKLIN